MDPDEKFEKEATRKIHRVTPLKEGPGNLKACGAAGDSLRFQTFSAERKKCVLSK
jgi:hypothetical protein